jgi:hypothetical protein
MHAIVEGVVFRHFWIVERAGLNLLAINIQINGAGNPVNFADQPWRNHHAVGLYPLFGIDGNVFYLPIGVIDQKVFEMPDRSIGRFHMVADDLQDAAKTGVAVIRDRIGAVLITRIGIKPYPRHEHGRSARLHAHC